MLTCEVLCLAVVAALMALMRDDEADSWFGSEVV